MIRVFKRAGKWVCEGRKPDLCVVILTQAGCVNVSRTLYQHVLDHSNQHYETYYHFIKLTLCLFLSNSYDQNIFIYSLYHIKEVITKCCVSAAWWVQATHLLTRERSMELRNRNVGGRQDVPAGLRDVALGPTIYGGERYSKMSERLKRQHKKPGDAGLPTTTVARALCCILGCVLNWDLRLRLPRLSTT